MLLITLIVLLWNLALGASTCNEFVVVSECVCPGQQAIYQCSVMGGVFTVYEGSAFECFGREISLRNSDFTSIDKPVGGCNSDQISISGRGVSYDDTNNCYTSQLNITLSEGVTEKTITCAVDHGPGGQQNSIGSATIAISTRPLSPPNDITVTQLSSQHITFAWEHVSRNCPSLSYNVNISSSGCGTCPQRTDNANITCANFVVPSTGILSCILMIQTVICSETNAAVSGDVMLVTINLKVPDEPILNVIAHYRGDKILEGVNITITMPEPFYVLPGSTDLSPTYFTIRLLSPSRMPCSFPPVIETSSPSCSGGICSYYSSDICPSTKTNVTVSAANILGVGMVSAIPIDYENNFVRIKFRLESNAETVTCTFMDQRQNNLKTCEISINLINGNTPVGKKSEESQDDAVTINIHDLLNGMNTFFYSITASSGTKQVIIRGEETADDLNQNSGPQVGAGSIAIIVILLMIVLLLMTFISICLIIIFYREKHNYETLEEDNYEDHKAPTESDITVGEVVGDGGNPESVYYKAENRDKLLPSANIILKHEESKNLLGVKHNTDKIIDKSRRPRPVDQREERFKKYSIYFQCKSEMQMLQRGRILLISKRPDLENFRTSVSEVDDVNEVDDVDDVQDDDDVSDHEIDDENDAQDVDDVDDVDDSNDDDDEDDNAIFNAREMRAMNNWYQLTKVCKDIENCDIYYDMKTQPRDVVLPMPEVMIAIRNDGKLFEFTGQSKIEMLKTIRKNGTVPRGWKAAYYKLRQDDQNINETQREDVLLQYDRTLEDVTDSFNVQTKDYENSILVAKEIANDALDSLDSSCANVHVYQQCELKIDSLQLLDQGKFVALYENEKLYSGLKVTRILNIDGDKVVLKDGWMKVFIQVSAEDALPQVKGVSLSRECEKSFEP